MATFAFYLFSIALLGSALGVVFARNPVYSVLFLILSFFAAAGLFILMGAEFLAMMLVIVYVGAVAVLFLFVVMMINLTTGTTPVERTKKILRESLATLGRVLGYGIIFGTVGGALLLVAPLAQQGIHSSFKSIFESPWWILSSELKLPFKILMGLVAISVGRLVAQSLLKRSFLNAIQPILHYPLLFLSLGILAIGFLGLGIWQWTPSPFSDDLIASPLPPLDLMTNTHALGQVIYRDYLLGFQVAGLLLLVAMIGTIVLTFRQREGVKRQSIREQLGRRPEDTLKMHHIPLGKGVE